MNPERSTDPGADGIDAPAPPGGPQRQDAPQTSHTPDGRAGAPSGDENDHAAGGGTIPIEDEQPDPEQSTPPRTDEELRRENAGTALDEPSEDLG